jgi:Lrp/AsnC family leucine-responsive transcriptional regulator
MAKKIDRIDFTILQTLQNNGRLSNVALAEKVNLSPSPCLDRVKRLESEGYISGYQAHLSAARLGLNVIAYLQVTLDRTTSDVFDRFKEAVVAIAEVEECHMVAGGFDYLLKLRFASMDLYRGLLGEIVNLPGVTQTHTYPVIEQVKKAESIPIELVKNTLLGGK